MVEGGEEAEANLKAEAEERGNEVIGTAEEIILFPLTFKSTVNPKAPASPSQVKVDRIHLWWDPFLLMACKKSR